MLKRIPRLKGAALSSSLNSNPSSSCLLSSVRSSSSAASSRWKSRQGQDPFAREAKLQGLKSRAAFKLLEMDAKYHLFKRGQTVIDLGFAPGSWSQVALERTKPGGQVIGIDLLPAQPPRGVSAIQGNFLSSAVRALVKDFIRDSHRRRAAANARSGGDGGGGSGEADGQEAVELDASHGGEPTVAAEERPGYIDLEKAALQDAGPSEGKDGEVEGRPVVDVVLSDMSEPWIQPSDLRKHGMNNAYIRMMNTSGMTFRDHAGSMDLCSAALHFASDTLRNGGHFVCKFYQGAEDKDLEKRLKKMFTKVYREKPESSRKESKEAYFVALRRKKGVVDEPQ